MLGLSFCVKIIRKTYSRSCTEEGIVVTVKLLPLRGVLGVEAAEGMVELEDLELDLSGLGDIGDG